MTLHYPHHIHSIPKEVFDEIITQVFLTVGIYRAVALRLVDRIFDAAIIDAICVRRVIDVQHESTPRLLEKMAPALRARIFLQPSRSSDSDIRIYMAVTASTNRSLDALMGVEDDQTKQQRHELVAENVCFPHWTYVTDLEDATFNMAIDYMRSRRRHRKNGVFETEWKEQLKLEDPTLRARNLLSAAALCGNTPVVNTLLKSEEFAAVAHTGSEWTPFFHHPLTLAAAGGHLGVVKTLLSHGYRLARDTETTFKVDQSISDSLNVRRDESGFLYFPPPRPWRNGEQAEWSDISATARHPLSAAVLNGHADVVNLLLDNEHRLPQDDTMYLKAMMAGAMAGRLDLVELLLQVVQRSLEDIAYLGWILLHYAVLGGHVATVATLEKWGVNTNVNMFRNSLMQHSSYLLRGGNRFMSTLQIAAFEGHTDMVRFLLARYPWVNSRGTFSRYPVDWAARKGNQDVLELLLDHDGTPADPSVALIGASATGQVHVMKYLLNRFPQLVDRDYGQAYLTGDGKLAGQRALNKATKACNLEAMTILVEAGACPSHGEKQPKSHRNIPTGKRPLEKAKSTGNQWVLDHLMSLGAKPNVLDEDIKLSEDPIQKCFNGIIPSEHTWEWMKKY
jgi:hypothetical protein